MVVRYRLVLDESKYLNAWEVRMLRRGMAARRRRGRFFDVRNWFLVELCLNTGLRVDEVVKLRHSDFFISGDKCFVLVREGKGQKSRPVRISENFKKICSIFVGWKKRKGFCITEQEPVFIKTNGRQLTKRAVQKAFFKCAKATGLSRTNIHCLRHTYGAFLYKASGYNLRLVQKQLGHSRIQTTETYTELLNPDVEKALESLSVLYRKV